MGNVFYISDAIRFRRILDEGVILSQDTAEVRVVNDVGIRVLELIETGATDKKILSTLHDEYDVKSDQLEHDVNYYLDELKASAIISIGSVE